MYKPKDIPWRYALLVMLGLVAIAGLVVMFVDVMDQHLKQAQNVSRRAGWQGKPVGVTPQTNAAAVPSDEFVPVNVLTSSTP